MSAETMRYTTAVRGPGGAPGPAVLDIPATWRGVSRSPEPWLWEAVYYEHRLAVDVGQLQGVYGQVVRRPTDAGWPWRVWFTGVAASGSTETWETWQRTGHTSTERGAKRAATGAAQQLTALFNEMIGAEPW